MTEKPFYVTTPIYYVNDSPHIGHAYTTIAADVLARFMRLAGRETYFLTGTDEHGQKVDKAAREKGMTPQALCDEVSQRFRALVKSEGSENLLNCENHDFIRTTEQRHKDAAQALWRKMAEGKTPKGRPNIELDTYGGWYAVRDEAYYQEGELIEKNGKKVAPTGAEVEWVEEESYFFRLSDWGDKLLEFYDENLDFVVPASRYNEVKSFVKGGLKDLSISRTTFDWGVPVPDAPGHEDSMSESALSASGASRPIAEASKPEQGTSKNKHIMYVWIDALTNYLTAIGYPDAKAERFQKFWGTADDRRAVHIVGKDILRFHAVYWPAFLMAADLPCPKQIVAHGWWMIEGEKMSKSLGNVIAPKELVDTYGLDAVRYFMLRAMPFGNDGDFAAERVADVVNADLANNIGNLAQRVLKMIAKNCGGKVPEQKKITEDDKKLLERIYLKQSSNLSVSSAALGAIPHYDFSMYLELVCTLGRMANEYIDTQAPWKLKDDKIRADTVLYVLVEGIRCIAILLQPFCPSSAAKILVQLGYDEARAAEGIPFEELQADYALTPGTVLPEPQGVFPRLEVKKDAA